MTLILNKGKIEVLPGKPCSRERRRLPHSLADALTPAARPGWLRALVFGRMTLSMVFPVLALTMMVGYVIWHLLGQPTLSSLSMGIADSTLTSGAHTTVAFLAGGVFIYLTAALLWPERLS